MAISPSLLEEAPLLKGLIGGKKKVVGQNEAAAASDVKIRMVKSEGLFLRREQQGDSQGSVRSDNEQTLQSERSICPCSLLLLADLKGQS